jgi:glycosyltransferase involved in cell wall biosynthesis
MSEKDKIRVASLAKVYGGKITSVDELAVALDRDRFEVIFIFLKNPGKLPTWMEQTGHKVFYLAERDDIRNFRLSLVLKLAWILRSNQIDVLHCHNHKANFYGVLAGALARTPVVLAQLHGLGRARNVWRKLANMIVFRRANRVIAVSHAVKQDILASNWLVPAGELSTLEDSVDYDRFAHCAVSREQARQRLGVPPEAVVFATVGRLAPTKGLSYLIEAFCRVREEIPQAHLVLLGEGPASGELQRQAAATPHGKAIHFLGYQDHVEEFFRGMDVFVLSSLAEGVGRALLEAMAAGVPAVATRVGGIPEVINEPGIGLLVPPRDATALAQRMVQVARLSLPERGTITAAAQERVLRFYSHDVMRERLRQLYEEAHAHSRARAHPGARKDIPACKRLSRAGR